jgi:hypothetical protein
VIREGALLAERRGYVTPIDSGADGQYIEAAFQGDKMQSQQFGSDVGYIVSAIMLCTALLLRLTSMHSWRAARLEAGWIAPPLVSLAAAPLIYQSQPVGLQWLCIAMALILGALLGCRSSSLAPISVDTETCEIEGRPTLGMYLPVLIFLCGSVIGKTVSARVVDGALLIDLLMIFAFSLMTASQLESVLRGLKALAGPDAV